MQDRVGAPRATAVQVRVNMERMREDGTVLTATGRLRTFVAPSGPGIRVDTFGYPGYETVAGFDSLLAKVIGTGPDLDAAVARAYRALCELQVEGAPTNADFLKNLLSTEAFRTGRITTRFIDDNLQTLTVPGAHPDRNPPTQAANAAHRLDLGDWASVLSYGRLSRGDLAGDGSERPGIVTAPMPGRLIAVEVTAGTLVRAGQLLCVMESMKVEHEIHAPQDGVVRELAAGVGDVVSERQRLVVLDTTG
jgi:acetyl/propionyl-CoA carboxylase alpha subunit